MNAEFLFGKPQQELASEIASYIARAKRYSIVVGFLTEEGVALLADAIQANLEALEVLVIGSCTHKAFNGLDNLINLGVNPDKLYIHLGFSRTSTGKSPFIQYHPMMHSKVYLFELQETNVAIVGSHNMTGFALSGQNGEAAVRIEFATNHKSYRDVKSHISAAVSEAANYDPSMKLAYAWWYQQYTKGLQSKILYGTGEEGVEGRNTILAITTSPDNKDLPKPGEIIYMEVPRSFEVLKFLGEQVHLYVLDKLPQNTREALAQVGTSRYAFEARVIGTNTEGVVQQGRTNWLIRDFRNPVLERSTGSISTAPNSNNLQSFVEITSSLQQRYEYLFENANRWEPIYASKEEVIPSAEHREVFARLGLIPPEDKPWKRVIGLRPVETDISSSEWQEALRAASPESGRFIMYSRRRRPLRSGRR